MDFTQTDLLKLLLAILVGGLIGAEREYRDRAAGFRTIILICVGAMLFTTFSVNLGEAYDDPTRVAANIVTGVGFLGAGVLMRDGGRVVGLTTAATIWLAAALGMGIGGEDYVITIVATMAVLLVLWGFPAIERVIESASEARHYEIVFKINYDKFNELEAQFAKFNLRVKSHKQIKRGEDMVAIWDVIGRPANHRLVVQELFKDQDVKELRF